VARFLISTVLPSFEYKKRSGFSLTRLYRFGLAFGYGDH
jgi:hypothetical protein